MLNGMEYDDIELCEEEQGRVQENEISTKRRGKSCSITGKN